MQGVEQLDPLTAQQRLQAGAVLVDVREGHEWHHARIPGAMHVPMGEVAQRLAELPRDRPLILQCAVGGRSDAVARWLAQQGFDVANLAHGIQGWNAAGLPVVTGAPK